MIHHTFQSLDDGVSSWIHDISVIVCDMAWLIPNFKSIKNIFFISHNIRRCQRSNVLNHPADPSGMDLTSDPSWFTHSPGKASTKRYSPQIFKGLLLFSLSTANKMKQILCVICFDTNWLSVLFKTVIIQSDDHNVPHYAYKTTAHV